MAQSDIEAAKTHVTGILGAVTGSASAMMPVPEIEGDPQATRKLAIALFRASDAIKALTWEGAGLAMRRRPA